jgi:hypothetical protein
MAVVGVEASVCLPFPSPIIGVLGPSAITAPFYFSALVVSLLPKPKPFPICAATLARDHDPFSPPSNGVVVPLGCFLVMSGGLSSSAGFSAHGPPWRSGSYLAARSCRCRVMATSSPSCTSTSAGSGRPLIPSSEGSFITIR